MEELFEKPVGRSETIPNQGLKISDLMNRSARLQNIPIVPDMEGDDEGFGNGELDDIEDKFDVLDRLSYYEQRVAEMKKAKPSLNIKHSPKTHSEEQKDDITKPVE